MCRHWLVGYTLFKKKLFIHLYTNKPSAEKTGLYFSCIRVAPLGCTVVWCCVRRGVFFVAVPACVFSLHTTSRRWTHTGYRTHPAAPPRRAVRSSLLIAFSPLPLTRSATRAPWHSVGSEATSSGLSPLLRLAAGGSQVEFAPCRQLASMAHASPLPKPAGQLS